MANGALIDGISAVTHTNHLDVTLWLSRSDGDGWHTEVTLSDDECVLAFAAAGVSDGCSRHALLPTPVEFWCPDVPTLYSLNAALLDNAGCVLDSRSVRIGFRDALFCAAGFFLNGRMISLSAIDLQARGATPQVVRRAEAMWGANLILCRIDRSTEAVLAECDRQGILAAAVVPVGCGGGDISRAILQLGCHPALCAWVVSDINWGKRIATGMANADPSRALLHLEYTTGRILIVGGEGETTRLAGGIALVG